jgi:hypothetical protein
MLREECAKQGMLLLDPSVIVQVTDFIPHRFCPESIRWLIAHGRVEEAEKIIERIAKFNKREKPNITCLLQDMKAAEEEKTNLKSKRYSYRDLFTSREIAKRAMMMGYIW